MNRTKALSLAQNLIADLEPFCERIQIAGSLRRGVSEVKDIEIVAIPKPEETIEHRDLFGELLEVEYRCSLNGELEKRFAHGGWTWRKDTEVLRWGPRYKRLRHESEICCDLFITDAKRWGYQLAIRTGPAKFSQALVMLALRQRMHCTDSLLHQHPKYGQACPKGEDCPLIIPTPEEKDFLEALGLPWIEPSERTAEWVWKRAKERVIG